MTVHLIISAYTMQFCTNLIVSTLIHIYLKIIKVSYQMTSERAKSHETSASLNNISY